MPILHESRERSRSSYGGTSNTAVGLGWGNPLSKGIMISIAPNSHMVSAYLYADVEFGCLGGTPGPCHVVPSCIPTEEMTVKCRKPWVLTPSLQRVLHGYIEYDGRYG